ncbi:cytochrome c3 family protein [uncultured Parasutterella sp.]|uniref:cytochrome c3 family protein n=1 Tax=uncultured Parasutterella sp. TaxID=1263098 RepID=UPI0025B422C2|nr:cytochrome c3 family protein [uncultured Parasutterella sp.]
MKVKTILSFAATLLCAAAFSMSAQAQLKNSPMHAQLPDNAQTDCLMCHQSYAAVAQKTAKMEPNPHSNHRGEQNCTNCHSVKGKPHFECNDCHSFNIKMKGE